MNWIWSHFEYKSEVITRLDNAEIVYTISEHIHMDRD